MSNNDSSSVYAAAQGREFLRNELEGKSNDFVRDFAGLVDDPETLDLLNYFSALWADEPESFIDTRLGKEILTSASTRMADRAFHDGNVSQLQGMVGLSNHTQDGDDLLAVAAKELMHEGAIGLVLGPPGSGKTALTLDVARAWAARSGGTLIGNTGWDGYDIQVNSDRGMLEAMASVEGPVLAVIDETAQDLSGFGAGNKKAESFADALTFVRKSEEDHGPHAKRGSVLMVNHTRKRTAAPFRRLASFGIEKPNRSDPTKARILETEGGKDSFEEGPTFSGITDTRETYPEHEASEFRIELADDDQDDDDQVTTDDVRREQSIATAIRAVKPWSDDDGMTYADAADVAGYSAAWVSDRIGEWREGEYRELVNDPGVAE